MCNFRHNYEFARWILAQRRLTNAPRSRPSASETQASTILNMMLMTPFIRLIVRVWGAPREQQPTNPNLASDSATTSSHSVDVRQRRAPGHPLTPPTCAPCCSWVSFSRKCRTLNVLLHCTWKPLPMLTGWQGLPRLVSWLLFRNLLAVAWFGGGLILYRGNQGIKNEFGPTGQQLNIQSARQLSPFMLISFTFPCIFPGDWKQHLHI